MDESRSIADLSSERDYPVVDEPEMDQPPAIGTEERRMHVRAYNYWVSLLDGRAYPSIEDLDPASIDDFGPNSVLLDFTAGPDKAAIAFLGHALREEGDIAAEIRAISDIPPRSLLSRLTDHYLEIIANRAPIGFEAEYVNQRNATTLYRGILMPFSSDDDTIDFIYGVISWKEIVEAELSDDIRSAVESVIADVPAASLLPTPVAPIWADGPNARPLFDSSATFDVADAPEMAPFDAAAADGLYDRLAIARATADAVKSADARSRAALYDALGQAHDFALAADAAPEDYAALLEDSGLKAQARAPMTPIVKLIFGADYDKTRLTEYAAVLDHGRRAGIAAGGLRGFIEGFEGGLKGIVTAERALRRPATAKPDRAGIARAALSASAPIASVDLPGFDIDYVTLVARRDADGGYVVVSAASSDDADLVRAAKALNG